MKYLLSVLCALLLLPQVLLAGDYTATMYIETTKAGRIPFEHQEHLKKLSSNCTACHNAIYNVVRKKNPPATMADMEKGKSCGACHNASNYRNPVQLKNCIRCHSTGDVPIEIPNFGTLLFSHSKHQGMYTCTDCHDGIFRPSRENPHYSMSRMEEGKSCGACHDGKTGFSVKGDCVKCHQVNEVKLAADTIFSHKLHLDISYKCSECHNKLFIPGKKDDNVSMSQMEQGKSCGACHNGKTAFSVKKDCTKCHTKTREIRYKAFDANFSHDKHIKLFGCSDCHGSVIASALPPVRFTMAQMEQGKSCGACHDGKTAFNVAGNCRKCHSLSIPDMQIKVKNLGTVPFSHLKHGTRYSCDSCHNSIVVAGSAAKRFTMAQMAQGKSCGACHDGKTAFSSQKKCSACHPVLDRLFTDDALFSHNKHLEMYTCHDCHSGLYQAGIDNKRYIMREMEQGKSCGACHDGKTAFGVQDCGKCHKSTVNISYSVHETGTVTFSHKVHNAAFKCAECHGPIYSTGKTMLRITMAEMEKGKSCGACHNGKSAFGLKEGCLSCHPARQVNMKSGSAVFSHQKHLDGYGCKDCHPSLYTPGPGGKRYTMEQMEQGKSCGLCHDGKTAFSVKGQCASCHPGKTKAIRYELPTSTGTVEFSHKVHLDRSYLCADCHYSRIPSGSADKRWVMKDMDDGRLCGACHGFSMAFSVKDPLSCERCHQKEMDWKPQPIQ